MSPNPWMRALEIFALAAGFFVIISLEVAAAWSLVG